MSEEMKKNTSWLGCHKRLKHLMQLLILIVVAWILGQLAGPAFMKAIFL